MILKGFCDNEILGKGALFGGITHKEHFLEDLRMKSAIFEKQNCFSAAQHINFISPQNAENGDPKIRNRDGAGKFREIQVLWRISTETLGPGNSGKFFFGDPILVFWGDFLGEMRMAKVDMLGRVEKCLF